MCTSRSSVSHWTQTKVTTFVNANLVLVLASFLGLETKVVVMSPVQVQWDSQGLVYCDFDTSVKQYSISNMLECMSDLTSRATLKRNSREVGRQSAFFPTSRERNSEEPYDFNHLRYPPYPDSVDNNRVNIVNRRPHYQGNRPGYSGYPPALPPGYPLQSSSDIHPGILGVNLFNALSSIAEYDDRKCVPRILCEVATGVIPGSSEYKQSDTGFGMNSLLSLLSAFDAGTSSPLLAFGKSALMGYANKGNPGVCYQQYPKCPRNPTDLVDYLNNHNGGFFRFFNNRNRGPHYRHGIGDFVSSLNDPKRELNEDFARTGYGNKEFLPKFQHSDEVAKNHGKVVFPSGQRHSKRISEQSNHQDKSSFFPQSRTSQGYEINNQDEQQSLKSPEVNHYHPDNLPRRNFENVSFPDNQSGSMMNVKFSNLFLDDNNANNDGKIQKQSSPRMTRKIDRIKYRVEKIQPTVIKKNPVPHSGVPFVGLAGGHSSLQQREHVEQRPPVLKSMQGAEEMSMGVQLFQQKLQVDENAHTVRVARRDSSLNSSNTLALPTNSSATSGTSTSRSSSLSDIKGKVNSVKQNKNQVKTTLKYRPPEGEDYPQGSCLENKSQDYSENEDKIKESKHEAIPVRNANQISKFVILTPEANIYIETDY